MNVAILNNPTKSIENASLSNQQLLVHAMLERLRLHSDDALLIPCSGIGTLAVPLASGRYPMPKTTVLLDRDKDLCEIAEARLDGYTGLPLFVIHGDFLTMEEYPPTAIALIPPMGEGREIAFIRYAYKRLQPGGRLVAVCGSEAMNGCDVMSCEFRIFLGMKEAEVDGLPRGSFKDPDAEGYLVHILK